MCVLICMCLDVCVRVYALCELVLSVWFVCVLVSVWACVCGIYACVWLHVCAGMLTYNSVIHMTVHVYVHAWVGAYLCKYVCVCEWYFCWTFLSIRWQQLIKRCGLCRKAENHKRSSFVEIKLWALLSWQAAIFYTFSSLNANIDIDLFTRKFKVVISTVTDLSLNKYLGHFNTGTNYQYTFPLPHFKDVLGILLLLLYKLWIILTRIGAVTPQPYGSGITFIRV